MPATGVLPPFLTFAAVLAIAPVAGIVHALVLLLILVVLMPYAAWIPMPIIAAILFMVAYNMCEWRQFVKICKTAPKSDILVLVVTFVLTVVFDLVVAIEVGMIIAVVLFMKRMADVAHIRTWSEKPHENDSERLKEIPAHTEVVEFEGPMFFASAEKFSKIPMGEDIRVIILRMRNVPALDATAMRSLNEIYSICKHSDRILLLSHTNEQPLSVMKKAGFIDKVGEEHFLANIDEALAYAEKIQ